MIKSFRGLLSDGAPETTIRLSTKDGLTGYRINKFELMPEVYGTGDQVSLVKVNSVAGIATTTSMNFTESSLLAAGVVRVGNLLTENMTTSIIFDNVTINQDIFITMRNIDAALGVNYHLELEQVRLDLSEATVATLKDMRAN